MIGSAPAAKAELTVDTNLNIVLDVRGPESLVLFDTVG